MKNIFIGLLALALTLGVACKKEELSKQETKKDLTIKKMANTPGGPGGIGGYPGGENTYPHNTGICYCGAYSVCHPTKIAHRPDCPGGSAAASGLCNCPVY